MSDETLRQPRTFWQWLTNQPGTMFVPPPPPAPRKDPTALDYVESELMRMHDMIQRLTDDNDFGEKDEHIQLLISKLDKLHEELAKRSAQESK